MWVVPLVRHSGLSKLENPMKKKKKNFLQIKSKNTEVWRQKKENNRMSSDIRWIHGSCLHCSMSWSKKGVDCGNKTLEEIEMEGEADQHQASTGRITWPEGLQRSLPDSHTSHLTHNSKARADIHTAAGNLQAPETIKSTKPLRPNSYRDHAVLHDLHQRFWRLLRWKILM